MHMNIIKCILSKMHISNAYAFLLHMQDMPSHNPSHGLLSYMYMITSIM